MIVRSGLKD